MVWNIPVCAPLNPGEEKLAELILYISQKSADDPDYGQTKLNKILFFSDFSAYGKWGEMITNAEYQHLPHGPGVFRMLPVQRAMIASGILALQAVNYFGFPQEKPVNRREANIDLFSGKEIAMVDAWIERLRPLSGKATSNLSHDTAAWRYTEDREMIDPATVFLSWGEPTAAEVRRGLEIASQHGLLA